MPRDGVAASFPPVLLEWLSAGVGCAIADTLFTPLEVVKVRRQVLASSSAPPSSMQVAMQAMRSDGLLMGLYQPGLLATWMRGMSYTGFRIGLYPTVRDAVGAGNGNGAKPGLLARIAAGAATGAIGSVVFNPVDVVRIRMQAPHPPPTTLGAFGLIAREHGNGNPLALWRGWHASAARAATLSGSQLATYDTIKGPLRSVRLLTDAQGNETPLLHSAASLASGFVAQTVTMPFDTMKTLLMADRTGAPASTVLNRAVASGGVRVLFAGYLPALARQGPVMLVQMPLVEQLRRLVGLDYM